MALQDKVVVITGGASGIGEATALLMAERGAIVAILDRDEERGVRLLATLRERGTAASLQLADVSREDQVAAAIRAVVEQHGHIDVLVNSAGIVLIKPLVETTLAEWRQIQSVNIDGAFLCCRAVLPHMPSGGAIVNVASNLGLVGRAEFTAYCASKGALLQLTRALALELAPEIRVNAVLPADTDTPLARGTRAHLEPAELERTLAAIAAHLPLGRIATATEVAQVIAFLAGAEASFVTGACYGVDGGYTSQ